MVLCNSVDVLIVGFGAAGAAAAAEAARSGATVLVVDRNPPGAEGWPAERSGGGRSLAAGERGADPASSEWSRRSRLAALRAAAVEAGAVVRTQTLVHELLVEDGRVLGAGCGGLAGGTAESAWHERLLALGREAAPASTAVAEVLVEAAERLWEETFAVETVACSAVVVATDRAAWDFLDPGMLGEAEPVPAPPRRRLVLATDRRAAAPETPLLPIDRRTGALLPRYRPVPRGLFLAEDPAGGPDVGVRGAAGADTLDESGFAAAVAAGRRAGRGSAELAHGSRSVGSVV